MGKRKKENPKQIVWNVAISIRLSKEDGNDESYSIQGQRETAHHYINNSDELFNVYDEYIDDGKTGINTDRDNFQRMLSDIEIGKVNCVIVCDLSRLSRNSAEASQYLEQYFVERNIRFISIDLPKLDSYLRPEEIDSMTTRFQSMYNENLCRETSIKIRGKLNVKKELGLFVGSFAPYGYKKDPLNYHHLIVDTEVSDIVKQIFEWFIAGRSKRSIVVELNELGIKNPTEYKKSIGSKYYNPNVNNKSLWSSRTIDEILKNQMYIGNMVQGKGKIKSYKVHKHVPIPKDNWIIVPNMHEAIIENDVFNKAHELLQREIKVANYSGKVYLFGGHLKCADCGKAMHRGKTGKYIYYSCRTYKERSKKECTKHTIREDELIQAVLCTINMQLQLVENIQGLISEVENSPVVKKQLIDIKKQISLKVLEKDRINRIRDELYIDWKDGTISKDDYIRLRETHDKKIESLKMNIDNLKKGLIIIENGLNKNSTYFEHYKKYNEIKELTRDIIIDLIDVIYVYEGKAIHIDFLYLDQQKHLLSLIEKYKENLKDKKD